MHHAPHDAFARVSAALLAVWPQVADHTTGMTVAERGLLLDHCGSDHRPLVDLLLDIGQQIRPPLLAIGRTPQRAADWANTRAPLVHKLVATRYLQPDVARWAVDVWGTALGLVAERTIELTPPVVETATTVPNKADATRKPAPPPAPPAKPAQRQPTVRAAATTRPTSPRSPAPRSTLVATSVSSRTTVVVNRRAAPGLHFQPVERLAAAVLGLLLLVITVSWSQDLRKRRSGDVPLANPEDRTAAATPAVPSVEPSVALPGAGAIVQSDRRISGSLVDAGVGGRYVVTARVQEVNGTRNCRAVAEALGLGRESLEVVAHEPGSSRFALPGREVTGTLDAEGWFTAYPRSGTTDNINWQFRMRGRFAANGFSALSETYTSAVLRWGRSQHCVVTAELTGRRLPD